jgi:hypothetical protein
MSDLLLAELATPPDAWIAEPRFDGRHRFHPRSPHGCYTLVLAQILRSEGWQEAAPTGGPNVFNTLIHKQKIKGWKDRPFFLNCAESKA